MGASCGKHEVTPVVGASTLEPKAVNEKVIAALQTDLLNTLEPKHRDADGQIDIRTLQKVFVKAVNASLGDQDPAYIAAALCLGSKEILPKKVGDLPETFADDAAVVAFCERALRKRLEEQSKKCCSRCFGGSNDDNSDPPVTAPPVHPAFMDRSDASEANADIVPAPASAPIHGSPLSPRKRKTSVQQLPS